MIKKTFVLHPFLLIVVPFLFFYTHNIGEMSPQVVILPIVAGILVIFFLQILLSLIITNKEKKGILISLFILMIFMYGMADSVFLWLIRVSLRRLFQIRATIQDLINVGYTNYLLLVYVLIFFLSIFFLIRTKKNIKVFNKVVNVAAISLIILNVFQIIAFGLNKKENLITPSGEQTLLNINDKPDIYYIILDGYANSNIMKEFYNYDNTEFVNFLIKKGFYVTTQSRSNYPKTLLSLSSSLNMGYLVGTNIPDDGMLYNLIQNNKVMQLLNVVGYKTINIGSIANVSNMEVADININCGSFLVNEYYQILFDVTMLKFLKKYFNFEDLYRESFLSAFSKLSSIKRELGESNDPFFVFAHIFPPHPPYLFGPNGEPVNGDLSMKWDRSKKYMKLYENQLIFVNKMMMKVVENIISNAKNETIIIIQSDHGTLNFTDINNLEVQMKIFNAILLPEGDENNFYDSITPVNTFRIIFNHYFKTHYDLLKDKSYFPERKFPYKFLDVTKEIM